MTERLYYVDAERREFDAVVRSCEIADGRALVLLDRTAFYPSSGGQPFDTGRLGEVPVVDVIDREDGEIVHVTSAPLEPGLTVRGQIDWPRRFDHMQQHTGQHVLSAVFERTYGVQTISFHLGTELSTIDLAREVTPAEIVRAEAEANSVIWDDCLVLVRTVDGEEAARLPLRKESRRTGLVRLVEVPDLDLSACGGTHVSRTGAIGTIVSVGWERFKAGTRLSFVCGRRALASHQRLREMVSDLARGLVVGADDIGVHVERLRQAGRDRDRRIEELTGELVAHRAREWRDSAETIGRVRGVLREESSADPATLRLLAQAVVAGDAGLVVVITGGGQPTPVVVARSSNVDFDAAGLMRALTSALGGRGGGRPDLAQGGVTAEAARVLASARTTIGS